MFDMDITCKPHWIDQDKFTSLVYSVVKVSTDFKAEFKMGTAYIKLKDKETIHSNIYLKHIGKCLHKCC
jgi:hypothetical protein